MATATALFSDQDPPRMPDVAEKNLAVWGAFLGDTDLQDYGFTTHQVVKRHFAHDSRSSSSFVVYLSRRNEADRAQDELRWLVENRDQYAGRWVALRGNMLLASGATSRDVFRAVADERPIPSVVFVEHGEELPFAGW